MIKGILKSFWKAIPLKVHLFTLLKSIWTPSPKIYQHLHFQGIFSVNVEDKSFRVHHYGYEIENQIFWEGITGRWEKISMQLWIELCKHSALILDVGANTGIYALVAKTANPTAQVHAFEPLERIMEKLRRNCELNDFDIICDSTALSDSTGEAVVYDTPTEHTYGVTVNENHHDPGTKVIEVRIKTTSLADYIESHRLQKIDLIKLDVERHEPEVLRGFGTYLRKMRPTLLIEILNDEKAEQIEEILTGLDYLFFEIDEINPPKKVMHLNKHTGDNYMLPFSGGTNFLICSEETAQLLRLV
ncbi:MAG: FkbM family methyltransferase [Planctomycetota bacterium]